MGVYEFRKSGFVCLTGRNGGGGGLTMFHRENTSESLEGSKQNIESSSLAEGNAIVK